MTQSTFLITVAVTEASSPLMPRKSKRPRESSGPELRRYPLHEQPQAVRRHVVRHRSEAESGDDAADAEPIDFRYCLGHAGRRAVDEAVLDTGAGRRQIARWHLDAHAGLAINSIAHCRA